MQTSTEILALANGDKINGLQGRITYVGNVNTTRNGKQVQSLTVKDRDGHIYLSLWERSHIKLSDKGRAVEFAAVNERGLLRGEDRDQRYAPAVAVFSDAQMTYISDGAGAAPAAGAQPTTPTPPPAETPTPTEVCDALVGLYDYISEKRKNLPPEIVGPLTATAFIYGSRLGMVKEMAALGRTMAEEPEEEDLGF